MRNKLNAWLAATAVVAVLGAAAPAAAQADNVRATSFSGAYLAGRAAEADNDLTNAIRYYKQALLAAPGDQAIQQSLMLSMIANGDFDQSLVYAEKLKTVADVERFSRVALAIDAFRKQKFDDAEHLLKIVAESDLDKLIAGVLTAWAKAGGGDVDGAVEQLGQMRGPEWYNLFLNVHRALIADFADRKDLAGKSFEETMLARSSADVAPEAYVRMIEAYARFLARGGEKAKALEVLKRIDEFSPLRPTTRALRADIAAGKPTPKLTPTARDGAGEMLLDIASALNRGGGEAFVRLYLQMGRALAPQNDAILVQLGSVAEQQQNLEEAIKFYNEVPAASPMRRVAELQLGLNLAELKRTDEAVQHLKTLLEREPDDMRSYLALGGVYAGVERFADAAGVYDRAVARLKKPERADWPVFYQRGIAYERLKQWPKAEPNFRKALELFPDQPQVLNYLGYSWIDMNMNLEEGLDMIKRAVELRPSDGFIIDSLGWGYYRLGRFEEAVTELERAVSLQPADPVLNDHLGDAYWRVGRKLEATFQWAHARDLKPDEKVLADVIEKLKSGLPDLPPKALASLDQPNPTPGTASDADGSAENGGSDGKPAQLAVVAGQPPQNGPAGHHTVLKGQSLWSIAAEKLGSGDRFGEILKLNPTLGQNPNLIFPGTELKLP
ncbi:MAG: tetratricopeptide repeat protein [Mesorhizobium sp.]